MSVHKECHDQVLFNCLGVEATHQNGARNDGIQFNISHHFRECTFKWQAYCDLCGKMIKVVSKEGWKCKQCSFKVHKKCIKMVPKSCGLDENLLSKEFQYSNIDEENVCSIDKIMNG